MASDLDISLAAADIYAQALLELANERDVADDLFEEFLSLVEYIESDDEFRGFMASFAVEAFSVDGICALSPADVSDRRERLEGMIRY